MSKLLKRFHIEEIFQYWSWSYEVQVRHTAKHNETGYCFFLGGSDFEVSVIKNAFAVILDLYKNTFI